MNEAKLLLKRRFREQILVMFGREPKKPDAIAPEAQVIHVYKKGNRDLIAEKLHARAHAEHKNTWRNRRWVTLVLVCVGLSVVDGVGDFELRLLGLDLM